jgi:hypothetical protein
MWSYYGAKTNIVGLYPPPKYGKIIEPFAGSARYALRYFDRDVLLVDKYEVIVRIWRWLQRCSPSDVLGLPTLAAGQSLDDFNFDCEEAKLLMGFIVAVGVATPQKTASPRATTQRPNNINFTLRRIAQSLHKIRHWEIRSGCYTEIPNQKATWFIDPPYHVGGQYYAEGSRKINFPALATWCKSRMGQAIVCENVGADWLPFAPMAEHRTSKRMGKEGIWTNTPNSFQFRQGEMF